jgi:hypothetical protein
MKKTTFLFVTFLVFYSAANSQNIWELGGEYQHGFGKSANENIIGGRYEGFQNKNSWNLGITYTLPDKGWTGDKGGFGFYAGYRYGFNYTLNANGNGGNAFIGFRASFSFINYETRSKKGVSAIVTPTAETGYQFIFSTHGYTTPSIGYGYNIRLNSENDAPKTDAGSRFITGISLGYRF